MFSTEFLQIDLCKEYMFSGNGIIICEGSYFRPYLCLFMVLHIHCLEPLNSFLGIQEFM